MCLKCCDQLKFRRWLWCTVWGTFSSRERSQSRRCKSSFRQRAHWLPSCGGQSGWKVKMNPLVNLPGGMNNGDLPSFITWSPQRVMSGKRSSRKCKSGMSPFSEGPQEADLRLNPPGPWPCGGLTWERCLPGWVQSPTCCGQSEIAASSLHSNLPPRTRTCNSYKIISNEYDKCCWYKI